MSSSNAGEHTLKPEGSYSQAKTLESEYSRQRAALTHAGGRLSLKPEGSYSQAKTLESEYSRQRAALTHAGGRLSLTDRKLNLNRLLLKFAIYLLLLPFGLYLTQTMASASGPFPVVKTKKWIFDSVEPPTIYHSIACASAFSSMLANEHEESWRQLSHRTITDIQTKHPTTGTIPIWSKQPVIITFCKPQETDFIMTLGDWLLEQTRQDRMKAGYGEGWVPGAFSQSLDIRAGMLTWDYWAGQLEASNGLVTAQFQADNDICMRWWEKPRDTMDPPVFLMRIMQQLKYGLLFNVITKKNAAAGALYVQGLFGTIMMGSLHFTNQICGRSIKQNFAYSKAHLKTSLNVTEEYLKVFPHLGKEPTGFYYSLPLTHLVFDHGKFAPRVKDYSKAAANKKNPLLHFSLRAINPAISDFFSAQTPTGEDFLQKLTQNNSLGDKDNVYDYNCRPIIFDDKWGSFKEGVANVGSDHRTRALGQDHSEGETIAGNNITLAKAAHQSFLPDALPSRDGRMLVLRPLSELICHYPVKRGEGSAASSPSICGKPLYLPNFKSLVQNIWHGTWDGTVGFGVYMSVLDMHAIDACPHGVCYDCLGLHHQNTIANISGSSNLHNEPAPCFDKGCKGKHVATVGEMEQLMFTWEVPFRIKSVSIMSPGSSIKRLSSNDTPLNGVRISAPSSINILEVLQYLEAVIGDELANVTTNIIITPDFRKEIEEGKQTWVPPVEETHLITIDLFCTDDNRALEIVTTFTNERHNGDDSLETFLGEEASVCDSVLIEQLHLGDPKVKKRLHLGSNKVPDIPKKPRFEEEKPKPEETITVEEEVPPPGGDDPYALLISALQGQAVQTSQVTPTEHPALQGIYAQDPDIQFVKERLVPTGEDWIKPRNRYLHGQIRSLNKLAPPRLLFNSLLAEDREDIERIMLGPPYEGFPDTFLFIQVVFNSEENTTKHIKRLEAVKRSGKVQMPVLDVHGKPRRNKTTGKEEEFYVEVSLPLVKWSKGVEIQQNRPQGGSAF